MSLERFGVTSQVLDVLINNQHFALGEVRFNRVCYWLTLLSHLSPPTGIHSLRMTITDAASGHFVEEPRITGARGLSQPWGIWGPKFSDVGRGLLRDEATFQRGLLSTPLKRLRWFLGLCSPPDSRVQSLRCGSRSLGT